MSSRRKFVIPSMTARVHGLLVGMRVITTYLAASTETENVQTPQTGNVTQEVGLEDLLSGLNDLCYQQLSCSTICHETA